MATILKPDKDAALNKAYCDVFLLLTKQHYGVEETPMRSFVVNTYKELLKKFLEGRTNMKSGLSGKLFQQVFEACPQLGWALIKPMLRCFMGKDANESDNEDNKAGSRTVHQRLLAVELVGYLIKSTTSPEAVVCLGKNLKTLTSVLINVVETSASW